MQGYIIKTHKVRDEDLIVTIVTKENLQTLYRFYGARHSSINLGYKIDFEIEASVKNNILRLRDVIHLGFSWMRNTKKLSIWQQFVKLFYPHLKSSEELNSFYYALIDQAALQWEIQNPKRIVIEAYTKLLRYEGRLHHEYICFYCNQFIENDVSLLRAFLPTHPQCSHTFSINQKGIQHLFKYENTLFLDDVEVDFIYQIILEGL